jgi:DNA-binding transcriptional LysR family regulator
MKHDASAIDLRLLQIFDHIATHRSVSRTAELLDIPQPAVSHGLRRLREHFGDTLFSRSASGMTPTPLAEELREPIAAMLAIANARLLAPRTFVPEESNREFRLIATDLGVMLLLPNLLRRLAKVAPAVRLAVIPMDRLVFDRLTSREADVALGIIATTRAGIRTRAVYRDRYACALRSGHPALRGKKTLDGFRDARYVVVSSRIDASETPGTAAFDQLPKANVALTVPTYSVLPSILAETDLMVIIPSSASRTFFSGSDISFVEPPFPMPSITVVEAWHERDDTDLGAVWLRDQIAETFEALYSGGAAGSRGRSRRR